MRVISILSQKGGAGKTTLAINLAVAARRHACVLVDVDPQASASMVGDERQQEQPVFVSAQAARLEPVLDAARDNGARWVLVDTAPHAEQSAMSAARRADFVLIPCRPSVLDLRAVKASIDLAKLAGVPCAVVLNGVPPRGRLANEAAEAVAEYGAPVCPARIGWRAAFGHALAYSAGVLEYEPEGKAAGEIAALYRWLTKTVKESVN